MSPRTFKIGSIDLQRTLKPLAFFPSDPTVELGGARFARASHTPDGPATVEVTWDAGEARVRTWGDGRGWLNDHLEDLLGLNDDCAGFDPQDRVMRKLWREMPGLRITASHTLWHDVAWLIPGQRVATVDAARQWVQ